MTPALSAGVDVVIPTRVFPKIHSTLLPVSHHIDQLSFQQPTILDPARYLQPLSPFSHADHGRNFGSPSNFDSEDDIPVPPSCFADNYLSPTLSENEYARLTMLWYYATGIQQDSDLLAKFADMLDIVKSTLTWEIALVGLVDAETFTRVATKNLPLATAPRRESPCSHTVNQRPGTVFTIADMQTDWRFQASPQATKGLRSYAGTQIRLSLPNGEQVSIGTVCVASLDPQPPLTIDQKASLVRIADIIMDEILSRKRIQRLQERQSMLERLAGLRAKAHSDYVESNILGELRERYPDCSPYIVNVSKGTIVIQSGERVPLKSIQDGLWEDTDFIKLVIQSGDFERGVKHRKIRIATAPIVPEDQFLVLATSKLRCVFDDLDVWFVDQCAQIINTSAQARLLREALDAKNTFLRSVTHELRTPIHAILSSVELATEAIKSRDSTDDTPGPPLDGASLGPFLDTIRRSSTELMTTVNNILRLNAFVSDMKSYPTEYNLYSLETDVLDEVFGNYTDDQLPALAVRFDNKIPDSIATVKIDGNLLKELLKCLILNAITATPTGSILVTVTFSDNENLIVFDMVDTGVGIAETDHQRIFQAFEKVNPHSPGAGLGLSLASQMASTLGGKVYLVSSQPNKGSHFRIQLPHVPAGITKTTPGRRWSSRGRHIPSNYSIALNSKRHLHLVDHLEYHLQKHNFRKSDCVQETLIITNQGTPFQDCSSFTRGLKEPHAILYVCDVQPTKVFQDCLSEEFKPHMIVPVMGPLYASRLEGIMIEVNQSLSAHIKAQNPPRPQLQSFSANNSTPTVCSEMVATPPATPGIELKKSILTISQPAPAIKALLVDDNKVNLSVLQMYCKRRKLPHGTAYDGNQAVAEYCRSASTTTEPSPYTITFMDLQMPECDGVEACRQIRKHEMDHDLPRSIIIILTGQDSVADRREAFEAGVDDYFVKPVSIKKLDQAIGQYFPTSPK